MGRLIGHIFYSWAVARSYRRQPSSLDKVYLHLIEFSLAVEYKVGRAHMKFGKGRTNDRVVIIFRIEGNTDTVYKRAELCICLLKRLPKSDCVFCGAWFFPFLLNDGVPLSFLFGRGLSPSPVLYFSGNRFSSVPLVVDTCLLALFDGGIRSLPLHINA